MSVVYEPEIGLRSRTQYGGFSADGREYVITRPDTPRPWINVLCNANPGYGAVISQTGSGYSWLKNAELNRVTQWEQDLIQDNRGKYLYLRDVDSGCVWSAGFQPVRAEPEAYECRHGVGYSVITSLNFGIRTRLTIFVTPDEPLEVWMLAIENSTALRRRLSVFSYLEWCLGTAHDTHREFHRTFLETEARPEAGLLLARKRLWAIPNSKGQGWNRSWDGVAFHSCSGPVEGYECDKEAFLGMYRSLQDPRAVAEGCLGNSSGKWGDAIGSLHTDIELAVGETCVLVFTVGVAGDEAEAARLTDRYRSVQHAQGALERTKAWWDERLSGFHVNTPDSGLNALLNTWLRYQAMAGRIWGRTAYYQTGGAYGFRDQLQDSHIFLPTEPGLTRKQILLHASHQFTAGNVFHWWQPITEQGAHSRFSDDLLWLPFVVLSYLDETDDHSILQDEAEYADGPPESLRNHCFRALDLSLSRFSDRGLPLIGEGDWNDGLSAEGWDNKGESVFVGFFLRMLLGRWANIAEISGDTSRADHYRQRSDDLRDALNECAWDGEWFVRATCDDGTVIGSRTCSEGRIFLNAQTWSILSDTCPSERRHALMEVVRRELYTECGPALLRPAYTRPDERVGYLTRYAPASRENGGVYLHAATWAIWAETLMGRPDKAWEIYAHISPVQRGQHPQSYFAEPYVTAGNIDGPDSPNAGRGGWSWYTGSAAWLFRVMTERVLGVRPEESGLRIEPCLPDHWDGFQMKRRFRGATYHITVQRGATPCVLLDGQALETTLLPPPTDSKEHDVSVVC
ncbi:MAG: glycosyl transferase family 36 [Armatimonadetes bacterium]|nr:glycosyl transferase family 36 [Armatimonadota bacterium]